MRPDFSDIDIKSRIKSRGSSSGKPDANSAHENWLTAENIALKQVYTKEDIKDLDHVNYAAGIPPYLRGHTQLCM